MRYFILLILIMIATFSVMLVGLGIGDVGQLNDLDYS